MVFVSWPVNCSTLSYISGWGYLSTVTIKTCLQIVRCLLEAKLCPLPFTQEPVSHEITRVWALCWIHSEALWLSGSSGSFTWQWNHKVPINLDDGEQRCWAETESKDHGTAESRNRCQHSQMLRKSVSGQGHIKSQAEPWGRHRVSWFLPLIYTSLHWARNSREYRWPKQDGMTQIKNLRQEGIIEEP